MLIVCEISILVIWFLFSILHLSASTFKNKNQSCSSLKKPVSWGHEKYLKHCAFFSANAAPNWSSSVLACFVSACVAEHEGFTSGEILLLCLGRAPWWSRYADGFSWVWLLKAEVPWRNSTLSLLVSEHFGRKIAFCDACHCVPFDFVTYLWQLCMLGSVITMGLEFRNIFL